MNKELDNTIHWHTVYLPESDKELAEKSNELSSLKKIYDSKLSQGNFVLVSKDYYFSPGYMKYPSLFGKTQFIIEELLRGKKGDADE